jgi:hypothetical protein
MGIRLEVTDEAEIIIPNSNEKGLPIPQPNVDRVTYEIGPVDIPGRPAINKLLYPKEKWGAINKVTGNNDQRRSDQ